MSSPLCAAREALERGERSSVELTRACLARIEATDARLNAWLHVDADGALAQAAAVDARRARGERLGPLAGVPVGLKDIFLTRDLPTTCGSRILEGYRPPYDATVVARLRAAGAVILGKQNMDAFAMGSSNENSAFGAAHNPWDLERTPGGSSGGSAAAVAAGHCFGALGTDTGGSIRQPASFCGVVGLKPTYGRVSRFGVIAFASSLDQPGPIARTVRDAAALFEACAGPDPHDATSAEVPLPVGLEAMPRDADLAGVRLGVPAEYFGEGLAPGVAAATQAALDQLRALGAELVDVHLPHARYGVAAYYLVATAEASSNLARFDGVRYGLRRAGADLAAMYGATRDAGFGLEVKRRIMLGTYALSAGYYDAYYRKASQARTLVRRDFDAALDTVDAIVTPVSPTTAFRLGERVDDPLSMYLADVFTIGCNLAGLPGLSVPCGFDEARLPVGLQLIGRAFDEATLLRIAASYEDATGWCGQRPALGEEAPVSAPDDTAWEIVIGLEVHCQLATAEKLFCGCPNRFGQPPNRDTCPICLGLPGVLPVLNRQAVDFALAVGAALGCTAHPRSVFARKHYFYPDLPKGYQITQYDRPLLTGGAVPVEAEDGAVRAVPLTRIHLEEDAGKSTHDAADATLVDLNRAGVPLIEIVGEPALRSAEEAGDYLRALHAIVRYLGVSDGNMEEGSFRCDANVSVRRRGQTSLGTRTEIKNLNTFKGVQRALAYEAARHVDLLEAGQAVVQETRLWDDAAGRTRGMRGKEEAHDYRYFPEPDLPPVELSEVELRAAAEGLPELPAARRARFVEALELSPYDAGVLTAERALADYFEAALAAHPGNAKGVCNWITSELLARVPATEIATGPVAPGDPGRLVALIDDDTISGRIAKQVFDHMLAGEGTPDAIIEARGLRQVTDTAAIEAACRTIIAEHPDQLAQFREGKTRVKGFFVGQVMKATRGKANPQQVNALLDRLLAEDATDP